MFDTSLAFRKIKPNVYAFIPGNVYTSKAYFVTYQEKKALQEVLFSFAQRSLTATGSGTILMLFRPIIGISISVLLFFLGYYKYKCEVKKIIGIREKQKCERINIFSRFSQMADGSSWKDIIKVIFCTVFILPIAAYFLKDYGKSSNPWDKIGFWFFTIFSVVGAFVIINVGIQKYILQKRRSRE